MSVRALPKYYEEGIPTLLQEMRYVADYPIIVNPCPLDEVPYRGLREMYQSNYLKFRDRLEFLEAEFLQWKTAKLRAAQPTVRSEVQAVETGECLEMAERWLKERTCDGKK